MRIKVGVIGLVLLLVAALASPSAFAVEARPSAGAPQCTTRALVVWLDTQGSGAAGSSFYTVELTNLSSRACTLSGYPRVAAVDLSGRSLGSGSQRFSSAKPRATIAPGATGSFVLQITEVLNFPSSSCRPVKAAGLRVFLPNKSPSKVVPFPFQACSRRGPVFLAAQAVRAHA